MNLYMEILKQKIQDLLNLFKSKKFKEAEIIAKESIQKFPNNPFLYNFLGLTLSELKRHDEAIKIYKQGIKIDKKFSVFYNNLGIIYQSKREYIKAKSFYEKAAKLEKNLPEANNNLGNLYRALNNDKKAIFFFKKALEINSNFYPSHFNIAILYKNMGKFKEAEFHLNEAIKINPLLYTAHRNLSEIIKYNQNNDHLKILKKIYEDNKNNYINKKEICFALGKAFEDMKIYDEAFRYYDEGNNLHRKTINFSIDNEYEEFNLIKETFNKRLFEERKNTGNKKDALIFILGMPRSGTTLVEQIISSHPDVFGGDELDIIPNLIKKYLKNKNNKIDLAIIKKGNSKFIKKLADEYLRETVKISKKRKITDKLTVNFKWIGLIKLMLPNSKIIHCKRNPKDTSLSIFKNYFVHNDLKYAYNLNELSKYYHAYIDVMNHWNKILPNFIYEIKYENLINNTQPEVKNLLKSLNLKWNPKCLEFHKTERSVKTASDTQIRNKIYRSSINSWKNFAPFMGDFFKNLPN